jgi:hypothetical protein
MGQFDRQIATAQRLIAKYGQSVTWREPAEGLPADPEKPWSKTAAVPIDHAGIKICFVPAKENEWRKLLAYLKGTEVPTTKLAGLMGAVTFTPALKHIVLRDGKQLRIASIDCLSPNGQKILYTLEFEE